MKTGQDIDRAKVGKNVIDGVDLHAGIVEATVEKSWSVFLVHPALRMQLRIHRRSAYIPVTE